MSVDNVVSPRVFAAKQDCLLVPAMCVQFDLDRKNARALSIDDELVALLFAPPFIPVSILPLEVILLVRFNKPNSLTGCLVVSSTFGTGNAMGDGREGGEKKGFDEMGVEPNLLSYVGVSPTMVRERSPGTGVSPTTICLPEGMGVSLMICDSAWVRTFRRVVMGRASVMVL